MYYYLLLLVFVIFIYTELFLYLYFFTNRCARYKKTYVLHDMTYMHHKNNDKRQMPKRQQKDYQRLKKRFFVFFLDFAKPLQDPLHTSIQLLHFLSFH